MKYVTQQSARFRWIGPAPHGGNKIALLIPQYNESSNCDILLRLHYFKSITSSYKDDIEVIIIDDGSSDDSLKKIELFLQQHPGAFYLAAVSPNANKVGALFLTVQAISHDFVILSDFDTDITGYDKMIMALDQLRKDHLSMGYYFRLLPIEGAGPVFIFQQIEYAIFRSLYRFYEKKGCVPVMPGAGACYNREKLLTIYNQHSGLRSGEDREATMVGLKLGYKTYYKRDVLSLTRPPLSLKALIKQRVRWNLGYLETYYKESKFYAVQVSQLSPIGIIFLSDILMVLGMVVLPFMLLLLGAISISGLLIFMVSLYIFCILLCVNIFLTSSKEFVEIKRNIILSILIYPIFKFIVGHYSWLKAIIVYYKKVRTTAA